MVEYLKKYKNIKLCGLGTHIAELESKEEQSALQQLSEFDRCYEYLSNLGYQIDFRNITKTAAALLWGDKASYSLSRIGIGAYGLWPSDNVQKIAENPTTQLKPMMTLKTRVIQVKNLARGERVGYDLTYKMERDGKIAVIPVGY